MRQNDIQYGAPAIDYQASKAMIEANFATAGMRAYATDTFQEGFYNGAVWVWADSKAPVGEPFITSGSSSTLTNYQILTAGSNVTLGISGSRIFISSAISGSSTELSAEPIITSGSSTKLTDYAILTAGSNVTIARSGSRIFVNSTSVSSGSSTELSAEPLITSGSSTKLTDYAILTAGSNVTIARSGSRIFVNSTAVGSGSSVDLSAEPYVTSGSSGKLSNYQIITAGSNISIGISGSRIFINSSSVSSGSVVDVSGQPFITSGSSGLLSDYAILTAGSNISISRSGSHIFVNSTAVGSGSSVDLSAEPYVTSGSSGKLSNYQIITAGSNISIGISGSRIFINSTAVSGSSGASGSQVYFAIAGSVVPGALTLNLASGSWGNSAIFSSGSKIDVRPGHVVKVNISTDPGIFGTLSFDAPYYLADPDNDELVVQTAPYLKDEVGTILPTSNKLRYTQFTSVSGSDVSVTSGSVNNVITILKNWHTIQNSGSAMVQRPNLNFTGAGVTVTDNASGSQTVVTIPGGGGGGVGGSGVVDYMAAWSSGSTIDAHVPLMYNASGGLYLGEGVLSSPYGIGVVKNTYARLKAASYSSSGYPVLQLLRARGTFVSGSAIQTNDAIGKIYFSGYAGAAGGFYDLTNITAIATENWDVDHQGATIRLQAVTSGSAQLNGMAEFDGRDFTIPGYYLGDGSQLSLGGHAIQGSGSAMTRRQNLNFAGAGVVVTDNASGSSTVVTIAGTDLSAQPFVTSGSSGLLSNYKIITAGSGITVTTSGSNLIIANTAGSGIAIPPTGVYADYQISVLKEDGYLIRDASLQTWSGSNTGGQDIFTVEAQSSYILKGQYMIFSGSVSHTTAVAFSAAGSVVNRLEYLAMLWSAAANTIATAQSSTHVSGTGSKILNATSTAFWTLIQFEGILTSGIAGSIIPQLKFSANPGAIYVAAMKYGSYISMTKIGSDTFTKNGGWG